MPTVVVREFARLTTATVAAPTLDEATVSGSAFDWLCSEQARLAPGGAKLVQLDSRRSLRLDNYVGVIETPCGTRLEILPKTADGPEDADAARAVLRRMLEQCVSVTPRESAPTHLQSFRRPLTEWVMTCFLDALQRVVKRGVRFDYHAVQEEERFLRGRLDLVRQLRQPPGREHRFHIEHEVFDADRPENRLLRSALDLVCRRTKDAANWRRSHELATWLAPVPCSTDIAADFRRWRDDRLSAHYRAVRPWCALILGGTLPMALAGCWQDRSLLFPMETLFERYVEVCLRSTLPRRATLRPAPRGYQLTEHMGQRWFTLEPDFLVEIDGETLVLDTKWKRLDASRANPTEKYGLSQTDLYQLHAYGQRVLGGRGDVVLIYPSTRTFREPLEIFYFSDALRLHVVPFDLHTGSLTLPARLSSRWPSPPLCDSLQRRTGQ